MILPCGHEFGTIFYIVPSFIQTNMNLDPTHFTLSKTPEWSRTIINSRIEFIKKNYFKLDNNSAGKIINAKPSTFDLVNLPIGLESEMVLIYSEKRPFGGYNMYCLVNNILHKKMINKHTHIIWGYKSSLVFSFRTNEEGYFKTSNRVAYELKDYGNQEKLKRVSLLSNFE